MDVGAFYVRRTLRIWPLYYALCLVIFLVHPLIMGVAGTADHGPRGGMLLYLTFLANFYVLDTPPAQQFLPAMVLWSVAIEEQFYLVWPLLFRFMPRRLHGWIFLPVILGSLAFRLADPGRRALYMHTFSVISDMAIGGLAAWGWQNSPAFRASVRGLPKAAIVAIYGIGVGAFTVSTEAGYSPLGRIFAALFYAFIVVEQTFSARSFYKMSSAPILTSLGRYTYGLYMLHTLVVVALWRICAAVGVHARSGAWLLIAGLIAFPLTIFAAWLSFHYFEKPFLRMKDRFARLDQAIP